MNPDREEIAIVGMAGRFPGARNVVELWENLASGVESTVQFSDEESRPYVSADDLGDPDYVRAGTVLDDADCFDASFFGYSSREAEIMDPQHRIFLECAWSALEDAGYDPERFEGRVGVFGGVAPNTYYDENLTSHRGLLDALGRYPVMLGKEREYAATRVAFKLNLRGPAVSVNTACSTSGVALHLACQSVLLGETDMALVGGARLRVPMKSGYLYVEDGILSPDGHCRAFDADARGTIVGNGVAIIAIRRLSDAVRDGDNIYAIIKGTAVNNDGANKIGFTAPSVRGQVDVITEALLVADVDPGSISYVEAHGTGTALGDPIEVAALTEAYRQWTNEAGYCGLGSVKTNIGHLDAAAGVAGVMKAALALRNELIPPSLNYRAPNPQIDFDNSPFFVVDRPQEWARVAGEPRRAAVSTFGLGGTNAHIILEEAPVIRSQASDRADRVLLLSAKTKDGLESLTSELAGHLSQNEMVSLDDVAYTLQTGRRRFEHRRAVVAADVAEATEALATGAAHRFVSTLSNTAEGREVVLMFPGGGAQYVNMAADLYRTEPVFRTAADECFELLSEGGINLRELLYPEKLESVDQAELEKPSVALPTLFTIEYALAKLWSSWSIVPQAMIGHSMGEYTAAHLAGVFTLREALRLVSERGRLFETLTDGSMLAVPLSERELQPYLDENLSIAAINRPDTCVVSGPRDAVRGLEDELTRKEIDSTPLHISVAAHSPQVDPILPEFREVLESVEFQRPNVPIISNVTGTWITDEEVTSTEYWVKHLRQTVRFSDGLKTLMGQADCVLLEIGPGRTLSTFASQHPARENHDVVSSMRHPKEIVRDDRFITQSLGRLWMVGVDVDWSDYYGDERRARLPLPTYPFERTRYWLDAEAAPSPSEHYSTNQPAQPVNAAEERDSVMALTVSRGERISDRLKEIINGLSGLDVESLDPHATFLELGFDSLFLTQANTSFKKEFKVKLTFRQMFEEAPTIAALAQYIDSKLPADAFPAPEPLPSKPLVPATSDVPAVDRSLAVDAFTGSVPLATSSADTPMFERMVQEQLAVMRMQLAALSGRASIDTAALPAPVAATPAVAPPTDSQNSNAAVPIPASRPATGKGDKPQKSFGPWKPLDKGDGNEMNPVQRKRLKGLIDRFNSKTPESKRLTQEYRSNLADPRTVAGFRKTWKEMVYPIFSVKAKGSKLWDVDGNEWLDITMGYGVTLLGHSPDMITDAIADQLEKTIAIGPQTPLAGEVAQLVCEITGHERAAFCNTGSEAVLAAIRTARTVTGRDRIAMFSGDYHGIFDEVLVKGVPVNGEFRSLPAAPGIPRKAVEDVLVLDYGDDESLRILEEHADDLAAVIVEPVQSRRPDLRPKQFVRKLRELTERLEIPLVFDEMITGFRLHPQGAQHWYGIKADIACYGKVIGGGMPIGVVAGRAKYLDALDGGGWQFGDMSVPEAGVTWFAGTFVRHPLSLAAARAALLHFKKQGPALQKEVNDKTASFAEGLNTYFKSNSIPIRINHFSSLFLIEIDGDPEFSGLFWHHLRDKGIHCHEGRPNFLTTAHSIEDMAILRQALVASAHEMQEAGFLSVATPGDEARELPITDEQQELWLACKLGHEASCCFNLSYSMYFRGDFDQDAIRYALQELVSRHESLRASVSADGSMLKFASSIELEVPVLDLSDLETEVRQAKVAEILNNELDTEYDLENGPLFRARVVKLEADHHYVLMGVHHIACDGFSAGILVRELAAIYNARRQGSDHDLPSATQYSEYCEWQQEERNSEEFKEAEEFWTKLCSNPAPPPLEIPTDRPRPPIKTFNSTAYAYTLGADLCRHVKKLGAERGWTMFSTMLGGFSAWLHRLTNQDDVVIGIPASGQSMFGSHDLVGHCAHHHPFRSRTNGDERLVDFLAGVQSSVLDAYDHRNYTEGPLLKRLELPRDPSRLPLISMQFNMDPAPLAATFDGVENEISFNGRLFNFPDATFNLVEDAGIVRIRCEYNTDLFDEETVAGWMRQYEQVLSEIVASPDRPISSIPLLTKSEESEILHYGTGELLPFGEMAMSSRLLDRVEEGPDRVALSSDGQTLTYGELWSRSNQLARHLVSQGVEPGSCVGVCLPRSAELIVSMLGILKAGGAYVPLDPGYPQERTEFILEDSQAPVLVTEEALLDRAGDYAGTVVCIDRDRKAIAKQSTEAPAVEVRPEDLAYVIYTSGSTGKPKGVAIEHRSAVALLEWARTVYTEEELSRVLASTSVCFDLSVFELFLPLSVGGRVILVDSALDLLDLTDEAGVTLVNTVPSVMAEVLRHGRLPSTVKVVNLAGEPLSTQLVDTIYEQGVKRVFDLYGPSETTTYSTFALREPGGPETIGGPIANERVYVLDANQQLVPIGVPGELYIGGAGVARGYLHRPELTAERFLSDPFSDMPGARMYRTGDLVRWHSDGWLEFMGRKDYQVKIRGFRIELGEIEAVLRTAAGVQEVVVLARETDRSEKELVGYVVADEGVTAAGLREHLRRELPDYMVPPVFMLLAVLPLTPNGKIDRKALPEPDGARPELEQGYVAPRTEVERKLAEIWSEVIGVEQVGVHDDFFELGGQSLMATRLIFRASERFDINLTLVSVFVSPTIAELADLIESEMDRVGQGTQNGQVEKLTM